MIDTADRTMRFVLITLAGIALVVGLYAISGPSHDAAVERNATRESRPTRPSVSTYDASSGSFDNAITGKRYDNDAMMNAMSLINETKRMYLIDAEARGKVVVATVGTRFLSLSRQDREGVLEVLFHGYSATSEIHRVEARRSNGSLVATYTHTGTYTE